MVEAIISLLSVIPNRRKGSRDMQGIDDRDLNEIAVWFGCSRAQRKKSRMAGSRSLSVL